VVDLRWGRRPANRPARPDDHVTGLAGLRSDVGGAVRGSWAWRAESAPCRGSRDSPGAANDLGRAAPRRLSCPAGIDATGGRRAGPGSCARREAITLSVPTENTPEIPAVSPEDVADDVEAHPLQAGATVREDSPTFAELGVRPEIVRALGDAGIVRTFA